MNYLKEIIKQAEEYDALIERVKTPKFRKLTPPPKPKPNYIPPSSVKTTCTYETPCGWCTKWDKLCDKKPYRRGLRVEVNPIDDAIGDAEKEYVKDALTNKICESEEDHIWECCGISTKGSRYWCKKCGEYKFVPYTTSISNHYKGE